MERLHLHSKLSPNVSDVENFKTLFDDYSETVRSIYPEKKRDTRNHIMNYLGIDDSTYDELKSSFALSKYSWKSVSMDKMVVPIKGFKSDFKLYEIPEEPKLKSLKHLKELQSREQRNLQKLVKYPGEVSIDIPEGGENYMKNRIKEFTDFLFTVRVYIPCVHNSNVDLKKTRPLQVSQEFLVCGNICLDTLRDKILCQEDYTPSDGNISENPFAPPAIINKDMYKSAMFFINRMFYIDGRCPENIDYSKVIKDWAKRKNVEFDETKLMENTKFNSLNLRLGYPYLYMHQGDCEHLIIFTDARLIGPRDTLVSSAYPLMKSHSSLRGKHCSTCRKKAAKFIVIGSERLPAAKEYLCGLCLFQFCYVDGKKVEDITVYRYVHRVALL